MLTLLALIASSVVRNNSGNSDTQTDRAETERKKSISVLPDDCKFDPPVYLQRYDRVRNVLRQESNVKKIVDLGCAEGNFIKYLKNVEGVEEISAVDVDSNCLTSALNRSHPLAWDYLMGRHKPLKIKIYNGNVLKTDSRLCNYDAVTCIELIEHLHLEDIDGLVRNVFGYIKPRLAIFTTPNADFNVLFGPSQHLRHWDHKFEWNRQEFRSWCDKVVSDFSEYTFVMEQIGYGPEGTHHLGGCTQMAIFTIGAAVQVDPYENDEIFTYELIGEHLYPAKDKVIVVDILKSEYDTESESEYSSYDSSEHEQTTSQSYPTSFAEDGECWN